uniref:Sterol regulatory element-binding protein ECM22 n=1 Tax=Talaromyces marneffei PM1 TaxID=1077442 RepID=A0A093VDN4_TALMA
MLRNDLHNAPTDNQSIQTFPVCNNCRSRKVRCDRAQPVCGSCTRLQLDCSFQRQSVTPHPDIGDDHMGYTQAGTKRKRARRACGSCRAVKAKCSGIGPCDDKVLFSSLLRDNEQDPLCLSPQANYSRILEQRYPRPESYQIVVAFGVFLGNGPPDGQATARAWMQEVQEESLRRIGRHTITHLRILVLLSRFRFHAGDFGDAWNILALAARVAFTMRMNYEHEGLDCIVQESHRRLMWAIYHQDRLFSGGIADLQVCPVEKMHIRLPCDDRSFEMGIASKAGFLNDNDIDPGANIDTHAFKLRLLAIRDRILRYTKTIRRQGTSPAESRVEMESLQIELDLFERNLPPELKLTPQRIVIMGHSREASAYAGLHSLWMMCHCNLYRFCIPGIRESVSKEALSLTPPDFVKYCQRACLDFAVRFCELWSEFYHLESNECLGGEFLVFSIYQVAQILHHLRHLLPEEGDICIVSLKKKLVGTLELARPLGRIFSNAAGCLRDSERLIDALGRESIARTTSASSINDALEAIGQKQHLASQHSVLGHIYDNNNHHEEEYLERPAGYQADSRLGYAENEVARYLQSGTGVNQSNHQVELELEQQQEFEQGFSDALLWDPFNMQLDGYYDPELDLSFV